MSAAAISGSTGFVAILGDPVTQVKSPAAFAAWAARAERDAVMIPMQVPASGLVATLMALRGWKNCAGAVITYPHKQAAAEALDTCTEAVTLTGACNVVRRDGTGQLEGHMTDGLGFVGAMMAKGHELAGRNARVIGAGGAGSAIALALLDAGVARLAITDTDAGREQTLIERLRAARPAARIDTNPTKDFVCTLVCNATPVGMSGDTCHPWPLDDLPKECIVADIVPDPAETPWIAAARARGHAVQTGPEMVAGQMPAITGILFPDHVRNAGSA